MLADAMVALSELQSMATLAAYSGGYEAISIGSPFRLAGMARIGGLMALTVGAAAWIGVSLATIGTVSETIGTTSLAVYDSSLTVRPLPTTLPAPKRPDKFERLAVVHDAPPAGLSSDAIRQWRQEKANAAVAQQLAEAAVALRQQRFEARFQTNLSFAARVALAVRHDGMAEPDAEVVVAAVAPAPAPVPAPRPAVPVMAAPVVETVAAAPAVSPRPAAPTVVASVAPEAQEKPAAPAVPAAEVPARPAAPPVVLGARPGVAVYDITNGVVHMPNGEKLEAHSGLGDYMDDVRYVHVRMRGPTPPGTYKLSMRESLFHGVEAIRLTPADGKKPFGRDGLLAHTYMLRKPGESNGCVSFRDYQRFLNAFKRGEVKQLVVVSSLSGPAAAKKKTGIFSWLAG